MKFTHYTGLSYAPLAADHFFPLLRGQPHLQMDMKANRTLCEGATRAAICMPDPNGLPVLTLAYEPSARASNEWVAVVEDFAAQLGCDEVHVWAVEDVPSLLQGLLADFLGDHLKRPHRIVRFSLTGRLNYPKAELDHDAFMGGSMSVSA